MNFGLRKYFIWLGSVMAIACLYVTAMNLNLGLQAENVSVFDQRLDSPSRIYLKQIRAIDGMQKCTPLIMGAQNRVAIYYVYCTQSELRRFGSPAKITENFDVPEDLARRFHFWRSVYSYWGSDQYLVHLSEYPEVVLEMLDSSRLSDEMSDLEKYDYVKNVYKIQKKAYRRLLRQMHKYRNTPEKFTPAMVRVASYMAHIEDKNKYREAARGIRIQRGQRDFIKSGLHTASKYLGHIEQNFVDNDVPVELALIAFVESSFNLLARSKVGASGVYQIMPSTGKQYLKVGNGIDERNDPIKASLAAAKLFALNYKILNSWPLAVTAYNHGVGGIKRGVRRSGSGDLSEIIQSYNGRAFGFASKNFYTSFLGVLATIRDRDEIFTDVEIQELIKFRTYKLRNNTSVSYFKKKFNLSDADIKELNPDLALWYIRTNGVLPRGYVLKLPVSEELSLYRASGNKAE